MFSYMTSKTLTCVSRFITLSLLFGLVSTQSYATDNTRPDAHAPIGVMADHKHGEGEVMFSYRVMHMEMDGNRSGTDEVSNDDILISGSGDYAVAPLDMATTMHMLGVMYAPSNELTLMLGVPFVEKTMDHLIDMNQSIFTTESSNIGDVKLGAIFTLHEDHQKTWLSSLTVSLPTGSIDEEDIIPPVSTIAPTQLPFPMQIGSGTVDLLPAITYTQLLDGRSWGSQLSSVIRIGENDNGYTLGNRLQAQAWHAWLLSDAVSVSSRLNLQAWGNIDGDDDTRTLPIMLPNGVRTVQTVDPSNQGGERADLAFGVNTLFGEANHRIAAELSLPFYQNLEGPQLQGDMAITVGYQKSF